MMKYGYFCMIAILLLSSIAHGQELITDRPDQTESSSLVPMYHLQWEAGSQYDEQNTGNEWTILSNLFRYGLSHKLELRLVTELVSAPNIFRAESDHSIGVTDLQIGLKYQLVSGPVEVAYMGHIVAPNGSLHTSNRSWGTVNRINIGHAFSENITSSYNVGWELFESGSNGNLIYTWAVGFALTDKLGYYGEFFGQFEEFEIWTTNISTGFVYLLKNNLQLDFSIGSGISQRSNYYNFGFSWRMPY